MSSSFAAQQPQAWYYTAGVSGRHSNKKRKVSSGAAVPTYPYPVVHPHENGFHLMSAAVPHMSYNPYQHAASVQGGFSAYQMQQTTSLSPYPATQYFGQQHGHSHTGRPAYPNMPSPYQTNPAHGGSHQPAVHQQGLPMQTTGIDQSHSTDGTAADGTMEVSEDAEEYCEYTRPCDFATKEADIDKNFSLGVILMRTARPANSALPATWEEANPDPSHPVPSIPFTPDRCPSELHSDACKEETLMPIRESASWEAVRQDPIFKTFSQSSSSLVSRVDLRSKYAKRSDPGWQSSRRQSSSTNAATRGSSRDGNSKKRVFSRTEHAHNDDPSKRHRNERRSYSGSPRYDQQRSRSRERVRDQERCHGHQREVNGSTSSFSATTQNASHPGHQNRNGSVDIGQGGRPSNDKTAHERPEEHAAVSQTATSAIDAKSSLTAVLGVNTAPQEVSQVSSMASGNIAHLSTTKSAAEVEDTSAQAKKESAWTKLARQYQEEAKRELELMNQSYD